jgi:hypothetical protein
MADESVDLVILMDVLLHVGPAIQEAARKHHRQKHQRLQIAKFFVCQLLLATTHLSISHDSSSPEFFFGKQRESVLLLEQDDKDKVHQSARHYGAPVRH